MKNSILIGVSILSVFILCSLSYQPIIADTPIVTITQVKESKSSNLDMDEIKELYNKLFEMKPQLNDDCGCDKENKNIVDWDTYIICQIIWVVGLFLYYTLGNEKIIKIMLILSLFFNCYWAYINPLVRATNL